MPKLICLIAVVLGSTVSLAAMAARSVALPTMETSTVHGGHSNTISCVTANMHTPSAYGGGDDGVQMAFHIYAFNFKNLSDTPQDVTINILPGTKMQSQNSGGMTGGVPYVDVPGKEVTSPYAMNFHIGAYADVLQEIGFFSNGADTSIVPVFSGVPNGAPQICVSVKSWLSVSISVAQDRGAIIGSVTSKSHRGMGKADSWHSAPISFLINGGRPF